MQKKSMPRMSMFAIPLMIACGLLVSIASARADSNCSNQTLHGDYGSTIEGEILGFGPVRGVAMAHFDGKGNMTQVDHVVVNGILPALQWTPGFGTYTVNPIALERVRSTFPGVRFLL
jgi:hypothetical protein